MLIKSIKNPIIKKLFPCHGAIVGRLRDLRDNGEKVKSDMN